MEEFMKNYGGAIVALIAAIAVLGLLFSGIVTPKGNTGLYSALGEGAEELSQQKQVMASAGKIKEIKSRPLPEIRGNVITANTEYALTDVFDVTDEDITLEVKSVKNSSGEDVTETIYDAENDRMCFPAAGTYRVRVITDDGSGGSADGWMSVKVQDTL